MTDRKIVDDAIYAPIVGAIRTHAVFRPLLTNQQKETPMPAIQLDSHSMLHISAKREALIRKLVAANLLVDVQLDWATNHAAEADLEELLALSTRKTPRGAPAAVDSRPSIVATILGGLSPTQLSKGIERTAAKKMNDDRDDDDVDETTLDRIASLTRTKAGNAPKVKHKIMAAIGAAHAKKSKDRHASVDDLDVSARMAGITREQLTEALAKKGWAPSEKGHGWDPPQKDDEDDDGEAA